MPDNNPVRRRAGLFYALTNILLDEVDVQNSSKNGDRSD